MLHLSLKRQSRSCRNGMVLFQKGLEPCGEQNRNLRWRQLPGPWWQMSGGFPGLLQPRLPLHTDGFSTRVLPSSLSPHCLNAFLKFCFSSSAWSQHRSCHQNAHEPLWPSHHSSASFHIDSAAHAQDTSSAFGL